MPDSTRQDRSVTLTHMPQGAMQYRLSLEPPNSVGAISICDMTRIEAREAFFMLGDLLGYSYEKKKTMAERVKEAEERSRADMANAFACMVNVMNHGVRLPSCEQLMRDIERCTLKPRTDIEGDRYRDANGNMWKRDTKGGEWVLMPATGEWKDRAIVAEQRVATLTAQAHAQDATLVRTKDALEVAQRDREALTGEILRIHEALAIEDPFSTDATAIVRAVEEYRQSNRRMVDALKDIRRKLNLADGDGPKVESNIVPAIIALQLRESAYEDALENAHAQMRIFRHLLDLPALENGKLHHDGIERAIAQLAGQRSATTEGLMQNINGAFAALKDHGYTPNRASQMLGELIRDAFGAEAAKLRQANASANGWQKAAAKLREEGTDSNSAWHGGHVVGYTSGSAAERERCGDIAQSTADRLDSAIALRIAQEIRSPK